MPHEILHEAMEILRDAEQRYDARNPPPLAEELKEAEEQATFPRMPEIVYHGLAGRYVDALKDSTEAPREFLLAAFLTVVAALIGRSAWVIYSRQTFANLFTLLIGETASARKTTVMGFALDLFASVAALIGARVKALYGLASVEGLAAAMKDKDSPENPYRLVIVEDELKSLLRKAQQKSVGNLIPRLTELYNTGATFEVNTKSDSVIIRNPFACVVSASTPAWFSESIGESEISGGFLNRWTMFTGKAERLIPFPKAPSATIWAGMVKDLAALIQQASGEYKLTPEAKDLFGEFYGTFRQRKEVGLRSEATARTDLHVIKYALLFAVLDAQSEIGLDHISRGIALATFNMDVALSVVGAAGLGSFGAREQKLLAILKAGRLSMREAMRRLTISADDLNRATRALERVGLIDVVTETTAAGRRRIFLEASK